MAQPPATQSTAGVWTEQRVLGVVRHYWGYDSLRPLQAQAIEAGTAGRDSLVVLPTGGGKSLCYQVPPVLADRCDVVVSPLISLMKDQVDGLQACGYPAAGLHSGLSPRERNDVERGIAAGRYRLLFVSPERLLTSGFRRLLDPLGIRAFAIDEAHCISQWGHDFRQEYRRLATLKEWYPEASLHAYTATATRGVRDDIVEQLRLRDPTVLVGRFDRPNLVYRVIPQTDVHRQTLEAIQRHGNEAVIVYCLSRNDTEAMAGYLRTHGVPAKAYHAGMSPDERRGIQDAFASEALNVVVATVAFGMGIDRGNVRCVIHATMPKSVEHYQQETGRAGRDGLEAECVLFYSGADAMRWESLIARSASEANAPPEVAVAARELLQSIRRFCTNPICRHRALSEYFGQKYNAKSCAACDVCLDDVAGFDDATVHAQKILSCVARVKERFGVGHVVDVLRGADTEMIRRCGHDRLSTYGLLSDFPKKELLAMTYQLVDQGLLERAPSDRPVLSLNEASRQILRGERTVRLVKPKEQVTKHTKAHAKSWAGVDSSLFDRLRAVRRELAAAHNVPAYVIFGDASLRDMARRRPTTLTEFAHVYGVGSRKLHQFGPTFVDAIRRHGGKPPQPPEVSARAVRANLPTRRAEAYRLFAEGVGLDEVATAIGRSEKTTLRYLADYVVAEAPSHLSPWVDDETYRRVAGTLRRVGTRRIRETRAELGGEVSADVIRLVARHLETAGRPDADPS